MKANSLEPLESRIAPAALVGQVLSYTDLDGDKVTVTFSKGALLPTMFGFHNAFNVDGDATRPEQLHVADVSAAANIDGANITMKVTRAGDGDGLANVGAIIATGHDLGTVTIKGDLCAIDCGDATTASDPGLGSLSVRSMGAYGLLFDVPDFTSEIRGALGSLKVAGEVRDAFIHAIGGVDGKIGAVAIGGSLVGARVPGANDRPGAIESDGDIGAVEIRGDLRGVNTASGFVQSDSGKIQSVTLGGSLVGGSGQFSGEIRAGAGLGPVKIAGDVIGGDGNQSGLIASTTGFGPDDGDIDSVTIGGSLLGGGGVISGHLLSNSDIGPVKIGRDVRGGAGAQSGQVLALETLGSVTIGGSLVGGSGNEYFLSGTFIINQGQIHSEGDMGAVKIGHDVHGSSGTFSGTIWSELGSIESITIGGSLIGGTSSAGGSDTGKILGRTGLGPVKIGHDMLGGTAQFSGRIDSGGKLASVTIGGSLVGGAGPNSGGVSCGEIGAVKIGGSLVGPSLSGSAPSLGSSGRISSTSRIASVFIGGSILAGIDDSTGGDLLNCARISAGADIGSFTVKGSLIGHPDVGKGASPVVISAGRHAEATATKDLSIGKVSIGGSVEHAGILAGYFDSTASDGNAQIGAVSVGGDWIASNLVAGVQDGGAAGFGDAGDTIIGGGASIAKIASITIKGVVAGIPGSGAHFGFVSHTIGKFKAAGFTAPFTAASNEVFELSPTTDDVTIREV